MRLHRNKFLFLFVVFVTTGMCLVASTALKKPNQQRLVLVGGGHAHLQVMKTLNRASRPRNLQVTLIDLQKSASYSGMVPGCIAGEYTAEDTMLHLEPLAKWADIEFINDRVIDIDLEGKTIILEKQKAKPLSFDLISLDIGSASRGLYTTPGALKYSLPTRPISALVERFEKETEIISRSKDDTSINLVVVGGGAAGIELSMSVMGRWKSILGEGSSIRVTLLDSGSQLLPDETFANREAVQRLLTERGISVRQNSIVESIQKDFIYLADGEILAYTHCLWASGAGAHDLAFTLKDRGLAVSERGWIQVNKYLQSTSHPYVFAAGDCNTIVDLDKNSPPKAGVYAVRSGPILIENLTKFLNKEREETWKVYNPQDDFLKLLVCGDGTGLGFRFGIPFHGKWVFQLKDAIDVGFMNLFKIENLPKLVPGKPYDTSQYDTRKKRRPPINPMEAAALLEWSNEDIDFEQAWDVLRDMTEDEMYRDSVLRYLPVYEEVATFV